MKFLKESNRMKHFWAGLVIGFFTTIIGSFIAGLYKENKDEKNGGIFDWLDVIATTLGGLVGSIFPTIAILILIKQGLSSALAFFLINPLFIIGFWILLEGWDSVKNNFKRLFNI